MTHVVLLGSGEQRGGEGGISNTYQTLASVLDWRGRVGAWWGWRESREDNMQIFAITFKFSYNIDSATAETARQSVNQWFS